ncbi:MAG: hypothetical protein R2838_05065 [Caldilineaceae bacterium]
MTTLPPVLSVTRQCAVGDGLPSASMKTGATLMPAKAALTSATVANRLSIQRTRSMSMILVATCAGSNGASEPKPLK